jgi:hypothetical protein
MLGRLAKTTYACLYKQGLQSRGRVLRVEVCRQRVHGGQGLDELGGIWTARVDHDARMHGTIKILQHLHAWLMLEK